MTTNAHTPATAVVDRRLTYGPITSAPRVSSSAARISGVSKFCSGM
ncbi:hypothetical protein [Kibdelosporangium phytohabitans]|nr:hypothetical protein [Kibdelosporangium phytohabitans]MBE1470077.1 hypothetical protein [Kibdelosporangium phytohabitans]